ncbi:MAG: D-glycerate dehydrogenase [Acidobacteriota bacterium]
MEKIFVTRRLPAAGIARLEAADVPFRIGQEDEEAGLPRDALLAGAAGAEVLICQLTETIDREVLELGLRGVCNMAVGFDNVDVATATELGVAVTNTPGVLTETTADFAWALLMAVARRLPEADRYTRDGRWKIWGPNLFLGGDVGPGADGRRKCLGIVGFGRIGAAVARRAQGFEMEVLVYDPRHRERVEAHPGVRWVELAPLLEQSDFVSLHPPLTAETHHLIGAAELARMKPTAYLINTARGPVVDEPALLVALREGRLAGAGLDVFENEPRLTAGLADLDQVVLAPHIASASVATRGRMATLAVDNALALLAGQRAPHTVDPRVYEGPAWGRRLG